jgi:hypothetical protein
VRDRGYSSYLIQHLVQVAADDRKGIFATTNDLTERIGQARPTTLEDFTNASRRYFTHA